MFRIAAAPAAISTPATAQDLALVANPRRARQPRLSLPSFWPLLPFSGVAICARSRLPGFPGLDRRAVADAAHRLCRARSRSATPVCLRRAPSPPNSCARDSTRRSGSRCRRRRSPASCSGSFSVCRRLRLRGLYLAVSTLALHFVVIYLGGEYETKRGFSTGIVIEPPSLAGIKLGGRGWYFVLLLAAVAAC